MKKLWMALAGLAAAMAVSGCETLQTVTAPQPVATQTATLDPYAQTPEQRQLLEAERQLAAMAQTAGLGAALSEGMDASGFVVRPGKLLEGAEAVRTGIVRGPAQGALFWTPDRIVVSRGADMGMTSGRYAQILQGQEALQGRYVTTWRKDDSGRWRILSFMTESDPAMAKAAPPAPAPKPAPKRRR